MVPSCSRSRPSTANGYDFRLHQNCLGRASTRFVDGVDVQRTYLVAIAVNGYPELLRWNRFWTFRGGVCGEQTTNLCYVTATHVCYNRKLAAWYYDAGRVASVFDEAGARLTGSVADRS